MPSMLTTNVVQGAAFVLFLASLPLISFGATEGQEPLWWTGLALIVIAGLLPPVTRFVTLADEEDEEEEEEEEEAPDEAHEQQEDTQ